MQKQYIYVSVSIQIWNACVRVDAEQN